MRAATPPVPQSARTRGFTLIELVITIAVGSVVVAFMALFIVMPMNAYTAQTRRADLVDASDSALRLMARDLRSALPNSVRVASSGTVTALELLSTADGAFATTVPFTQLTLPFSSSTSYLSIYNVGVPGADAYQMANVITPPGTTITIAAGGAANQNLVALSPPFQFAFGSPGKRVYLVSGPVSYLCDTAAGTLTRYAGYAIAAGEPTSAAALVAAGASAALVAANVAGCQFTYSAGTAQRNALATLTLQIAENGESVQLLNEVQVVNAP